MRLVNAEVWEWVQYDEKLDSKDFAVTTPLLSAGKYTFTFTLFDAFPGLTEEIALLAIRRTQFEAVKEPEAGALGMHPHMFDDHRCTLIISNITLIQSSAGLVSVKLDGAVRGVKYSIGLKILSSHYVSSASNFPNIFLSCCRASHLITSNFSAEGPHITRLSVVCPADRESHHGDGIHEAVGPEDWTVEKVHQGSSDDELKEAWRGLDPTCASVPWRLYPCSFSAHPTHSASEIPYHKNGAVIPFHQALHRHHSAM